MRKGLVLFALAVVCNAQLTADFLLCKSYLLNDRSDCYDSLAFNSDIGAVDARDDFAECMREASDAATECRAQVDTSCR